MSSADRQVILQVSRPFVGEFKEKVNALQLPSVNKRGLHINLVGANEFRAVATYLPYNRTEYKLRSIHDLMLGIHPELDEPLSNIKLRFRTATLPNSPTNRAVLYMGVDPPAQDTLQQERAAIRSVLRYPNQEDIPPERQLRYDQPLEVELHRNTGVISVEEAQERVARIGQELGDITLGGAEWVISSA